MRIAVQLPLSCRSISLGLAFAASALFAQAPKPPAAGATAAAAMEQKSDRVPTSAPSDESKEAIVVEQYTTNVTFAGDGTGAREVTAVIRVQAEAGVQQFGVLSFGYTAASQTVEVDYVRVRRPDGTVVATPDYNIQDMPSPVTRVAPMYSDVHEKHVVVKGLGVGDVLEYKVRFKIVKPEVLGQFWFDYRFTRDVVVKNEQLILSVPKDKHVRVISPDYKPVSNDIGTNQVYTWKTSNPKRERHDVPRRFVPPPSVQVTTFQSWDEVGHWYNGLQQPQMTVTPEIRTKAAELTRGLTSDDERLHAIYKFVSTRIHYISLSFGIGRYQPHAADDVLGNEYGDCKDKHTLLAALLKAAGYEAWPALISTSRTFSPDVPSPGQFDHVITVVSRPGSLIWLDTTPEIAPFEVLGGQLRNKEALVIPPQAPGYVAKTPPDPPMRTAFLFEMKGKLDNEGTFIGHAKVSIRGDLELLYRSGFRSVSPAQWNELVQRIAQSQGFGGDVSEVSTSPVDDLDRPFEFSYTYTRKNYGDWPNRRIISALPYTTLLPSPDDAKQPVDPVFLGAPGELVFRSEMELPSGYRPKLPANLNLVDDFVEYHMSYALKGTVFTAERRLVIKQRELPLSSWAEYKKVNKEINDDQGRWIDEEGKEEAAGTATGNPEADKAMEEAHQAYQKRDFAAARAAIRRALEINPKYPRAHSTIAVTYLAQGNMLKAIEELEKEEDVNPDFEGSYKMLSEIYRRRDQDNEAAGELRKLLKVHPTDVDVAVSLGDMLRVQKKYAEAIEAMEPALKLAPDNVLLQFSLGSAYLRSGQNEKALPLLEAVADRDDEDEMRSAVANQLADQKVELNKAKTYAERSVQSLEMQSAKLQHPSEKGYELTRAVANAWDSRGWVYFRLGDLQNALRYSRAAWQLSQSAWHGMHLAEIYEAQGNKADAAHMYKLAQTCQGANKELIQQRYQKLTGEKLDDWPTFRLHRGPQQSMPPEEELSRARDVKISNRPHASGSAVFAIMLSPGKVDEAVWVSGAENMKPLSAAIAAAKFNVMFPDAGPVKLARRGILMCGSTGCELTMLLPDSVHAVDE